MCLTSCYTAHLPFRTAGSAKNHFPVLFTVDQITLALSLLEATWRTKQKEPHTKLMFIWGEGWGHILGPGHLMNLTEGRQLRLETIVWLQPLFSFNLSISCSLFMEQRGSSGCFDFCKCFAHLVVVYHLDRMLHRGFFSPLWNLKRKWLLYVSYMIHKSMPYFLHCLKKQTQVY